LEKPVSFWDDPSVKPASTDYVRFEKVGDEVSGTIAKLGKRVFNAGTADERTAVEISWVEEDVPTLTAGQILLQRALFDFRPAPGDHLTVRLSAVEKKGGKTLKRFAVTLKRADGTEESVDQKDAA
jgi:hypothetical protein